MRRPEGMGLSEDIERLALQERELVLPRLDADVAWDLGTRLRAMALERGLAIVIDVRRFGQPLFYVALDGTNPDNPNGCGARATWWRGSIAAPMPFASSSRPTGKRSLRSKACRWRTLPSTAARSPCGWRRRCGGQRNGVGTRWPRRSRHGRGGLCALLGKEHAALRLVAE